MYDRYLIVDRRCWIQYVLAVYHGISTLQRTWIHRHEYTCMCGYSTFYSSHPVILSRFLLIWPTLLRKRRQCSRSIPPLQLQVYVKVYLISRVCLCQPMTHCIRRFSVFAPIIYWICFSTLCAFISNGITRVGCLMRMIFDLLRSKGSSLSLY